jgi:hypothetical protein
MANAKISQLTALTTPASGDLFPIVDISDTTQSASGTTKKITDAQVIYSPATVVVAPSTSTHRADYYTDGTADDVQIQQAITAVAAAGGGRVLIKAGTYVVDAQLQINSSNIIIEGEGVGVTTLQCNFDAADIGQSYIRGVLAFWHTSGTVLVSNVQVRNLSINLNHLKTAGLNVYQNKTGTASGYLFENIEIYNRAPDATGSMGAITVVADYGSLNPGNLLKDMTFKNIYIHDGDVSTSPLPSAYSMLFLSNSLSNVKILNCTFRNVYGSTIGFSASTTATRKDWSIDSCTFENTVQNYISGSLADIADPSRQKFHGIRITNNYFYSSPGHWTINDDVYNIMIYNSTGYIVDHNVFYNSRAIHAPGHSFPHLNESIGWTFSNNIIMDAISFADSDGHVAGIYSNNIFYRLKRGAVIGGYGFHTPSVIDGNLFVNCCWEPQTDAEYYKGVFLIETAGNIISNNTIYQDAPLTAPASAPTLAAGATGVLTGTYRYKVTFASNFAETEGGTGSSPITVTTKQIGLTTIPLGPTGTVARKIYRTSAGGAAGTEKYVGLINENTTTIYTDNLADASLGDAIPTTNGAITGLKYVFCELYGGIGAEYPNVYKNNSVLGYGATTLTFYLDSAYGHLIAGNSGLTEGLIKNSELNGNPSVSVLPATDVVYGNYKLDGTLVRGRVVSNTGTATVISGATTVVVSHGLSDTPTLDNILVTPTNNLGTATKFWISTLTSTQFTINVDANPGASTATFAWRAEVKTQVQDYYVRASETITLTESRTVT